MDPRVATAPSRKGKKWATKTSGASCLLRQPSSKNDLRLDAASVVDRPHSCPVPTLTPQFHWNLNNSALNTLTRNQIKQLYGLFTFYDSSMTGDDLPSINCARLVDILREARLLKDNAHATLDNESSSRYLQQEAVERIFAQAVLGVMRLYLDADGQPALTFPLFCSALMNCAMLLAPSARPEAALRQIMPLLLKGSTLNGNQCAGGGLLCHFPTEGTISLWMPDQACPSHEPVDQQWDFRALPPFQQVIADCTRDKLLDELKQEKLARSYQIPTHLIATFHRDTIALISNKFRMFDVFDRGLLPRHEVFPLLSSLGKHADLPDPYAVFTTLSASSVSSLGSENIAAGSGVATNNEEITLAQLLQAIEATREAKRHLVTARLAAIKINSTQVEPTISSAVGMLPSAMQTEPMVSFPENDSNNDQDVDSHEATAHHHGSSAYKEGLKKGGISRLRSRKVILSHGSSSSAVGTSHQQLGSKHRNTPGHPGSVSVKKKTEFSRKSSLKKVNTKQDNAAVDPSCHRRQSSNLGDYSQRSATTFRSISDDESTKGVLSLPADADFTSQQLVDHEAQKRFETRISQKYEPTSAQDSKTLQIFLLLGGDHDGAICCKYSLAFATREIMESEGVHYSITQSETTRTTPVLPTQSTLMSALLMLKKCVLARQNQGFELLPANQLDGVEDVLRKLQKKQPHYSIARSPVPRTLCGAGLAAVFNAFKVGSKFHGCPQPEQISQPQPWNNDTLHTLATSDPTAPLLLPPIIPDLVGLHNSSPIRKRNVIPLEKSTQHHQVQLPSNYRNLFALWEVSQGDNSTWIHDVNAASPLKPASPTRSQSSLPNQQSAILNRELDTQKRTTHAK